MRKTCNNNFKFMNDIDLFGKEAELYYKGKSKRTSCLGISFTIIYVLVYIAFFIYKVIRMFVRVDVTFYDTYAFTGEPPHIKLTDDKFYGGFALGNPLTLQTFVNDSIYYVKAFYITGVKEGSVWNWTKIPLELETCKLESFGKEYRDIFKDKAIDQLHCVPILDQVLQGHLTYDVYSYFYIQFFPCINGMKNRSNCSPLSFVQKMLTQTFVTFKMEDVDLTPQLYHSPVALRGKEVSANVGKSLFQDVHSFFQIINIETDEDILGFEALSSIKKEKYIKYDQSVILSSLKGDIFETGDSICDVTIALSEQELTQKRTYPKLIEVLGDVGGLMEVFFSFFRIISSFLIDTLYEINLVNHLFSFDLDKKVLLIKNKKAKKSNLFKGDSPKIYSPNKNSGRLSYQNSIYNKNDMTIEIENKLNEENLLKNKKISESILIKQKKRKKRNIKSSTAISSTNRKYDMSELKSIGVDIDIINEEEKNNSIKIHKLQANKNNENIENVEKRENIENKEKDIKKENDNNNINNNAVERDKNREIEKKRIIKKVKINKACTYLCFLCIRKWKNVQNVLLDEGMKVITEKLDIMNLFKKLYIDEKIQEKANIKDVTIELSYECKENFKKYI